MLTDADATLAETGRTSGPRRRTVAQRLRTAGERDAIAHARDVAGRARDVAGEARDRAMVTLEELMADKDRERGESVTARAAAVRRRAADFRAQAAEYRGQAAADRAAGAGDRDAAARDRLAALSDREQLASRPVAPETDALTATRARTAALQALEPEIDRSHRTGATLTVAYVDIAGSTAGDDRAGRDGRAAGDGRLIDALECIREHLRTYDQITRISGHELVCAMPNVSLTDARTRFCQIGSALAGAAGAIAIRTGYAELGPGDTAAELVARAGQGVVDTATTRL